MDRDLADEIDFMCDLLAKSGFFNEDEIIEILQDQFIEEDIDFTGVTVPLNESSNENFARLESVFKSLKGEKIIAVHNCGYDIGEGVEDIFELYVHIFNNGFKADGFCFYTFEDVEDAIFEENLKITYGDFQKDEAKALKIGQVICDYLKGENFNVVWDGTLDNQIEISPFEWDKSYDGESEYELEGAYEYYTGQC